MSDVFVYFKSETYEQNFERWYEMNTLERETWSEPKLTKEAAEDLFRSLYKDFTWR